MDKSDNTTVVTREPVIINKYDDLYQLGLGCDLPSYSMLLATTYLPDDEYLYTLVEGDMFASHFSDSNAFPGPCKCGLGFSLNRDPTSWVWITGGWLETSVRHRPSSLGSLSLSYPSVFCTYIINISTKSIYTDMTVYLYRRLREQ